MTVDFLGGTVTEGIPSEFLSKAVVSCRNALPGFFEKHGASISDFREITARYSNGGYLSITIEDARGRRSTTEYVGVPSRRIRVLDSLGRVRRKA
ncbi:MAG: hypothetical protein ABIQ51_24200 [Mesorhizobium sp.]